MSIIATHNPVKPGRARKDKFTVRFCGGEGEDVREMMEKRAHSVCECNSPTPIWGKRFLSGEKDPSDP